MNMKKYINTISAALLILCFASSCVDLNMNPPSEASSENWYKNADQITMSLNDLYRKAFYGMESGHFFLVYFTKYPIYPYIYTVSF